jgi:hypothetical protein
MPHLFSYVVMNSVQGKHITKAIFDILAPTVKSCVRHFDKATYWASERSQGPVSKIIASFHACVLDLSLTHLSNAELDASEFHLQESLTILQGHRRNRTIKS